VKYPKIILITLLCCSIGFLLGMGSYAFTIGRGFSYFKNDPNACMNCHIMREQFNTWQRSSHRNVTTCNTCHAPENFFMEYLYKAENGFSHGLKFTTGNFIEPIRIRKHNFDVTMKACFRCHSALMDSTLHQQGIEEGITCLHCHKDVGHSH
jgi:cytochrome c nitrite reductase small subunit